ncbi:MAG TPA: hypothetical protein PKD90_20340, partial [Phnomibacter sp.]|nr:hypothetical protein [Phnomibacter sp.]
MFTALQQHQPMRYYFFWYLLLLFCLLACKKEAFITNANASLQVPEAVHFDTVFTTTGSITRSFTIVNPNPQKLRLSSLALAGGAASAFSINVNGKPGTRFTNVDIDANDSIYVFVRATINPGNHLSPFLVRDSIEIAFNGNEKKVQLRAFGQNARFITEGSISTNTRWTNELPYVIVRPLTIEAGATLTIDPGTRLFFNAGAPLLV